MKGFYEIYDRTFHTRGMPWIAKFTEGVVELDKCAACGRPNSFAQGDMLARLMEENGTQWSDLIGTGSRVGLFVASSRFVEAPRSHGVRVELGGRVEFDEPGPKRLALAEAPDYYWVDGERHLAARMDFEASGFVGVWYCPECGARSGDVRATRVTQYTFDYDAASGLDLFTTDMSPNAFFCTERVLECAREHRLTNVAITRVEDGPDAKPIKFW